MKTHEALIYLLLGFYLLCSIPSHASPNYKYTNRSVNIAPHTHEFTLILKKNALLSALDLVAPNGKKYSLTKINNGLLATKNNDIIKINEPAPGEWILSGPRQQIEHILVLTDVNLDTNFTNGIYFNGELLPLAGYLAQGKKPLHSDMAVDSMEMNFELKNKNNKFSYIIPYEKNGLFDNQFILDVPSATYKATWKAKNTYFSQTHKFIIAIQDVPFKQDLNPNNNILRITLIQPGLIKEKSVGIKILYLNAPHKIKVTQHKLSWITNLTSLCQKADFSEDNILLEISAQKISGRNLLFRLLLNGKLCAPRSQAKS